MKRLGTAASSPSSHSVITTSSDGPRAAHVDDVAPLEVPDEDGSAGARLDPAGGVGPGDAGGDFGLLVERSAHALAEALGSVICDGDEHLAGTTIDGAPVRT